MVDLKYKKRLHQQGLICWRISRGRWTVTFSTGHIPTIKLGRDMAVSQEGFEMSNVPFLCLFQFYTRVFLYCCPVWKGEI